MDNLVLLIQGIARKQAAGESLTPEEKRQLSSFGETIANLSYFESTSFEADEMLPWMAMIADVHTGYNPGACLEVGCGPAMPIYVVIPSGEKGGRYFLAVGGVCSYYQFRRPFEYRLTDEEWKKMLSAGALPHLPGWTDSFVAGFEPKELIAKLRKGEIVEELACVKSPEIELFLDKAIGPGGGI